MIQGSDEWFAARAGKITASRLGDVLANPKTKRYKNYLQEIVDDLLGIPSFGDNDKPWFEHGKRLEPIARKRYEWECFRSGSDIEVTEIPIIVHPKYNYISCSPDGIIDMQDGINDYGLEIKCRVSNKAHQASIKAGLPSNYKPQVQGCLWVTGCKRWDFVSYFEDPDGIIETDINITVVEPDLEYHQKLETACLSFWEDVQAALKL